MRARRFLLVLCALTFAVGLSACGHKEAHPTQANANNDGGYIDAGPVTYQLQISRELNPYSAEDSEYLKGLPSGAARPSPSQFWYGVFLWAKNQTGEAHRTLDNFEITDTEGNAYYPVELDSAVNPFAWTSAYLQPNGIQPAPNTVASEGPTQGGLLLFKLNDTAYSNRPLTLWLLGPDNKKLGSISLNL